MDSLLATYASSDEEEDNQQQQQPAPHPPPSSKASSLFSSLPRPQSSSSTSSSSVFSSLPPPKSTPQTPFSLPTPKKLQDSTPSSKSAALFTSLPAPKSQMTTDFNIPPPNPKRVVHFRPPAPIPSTVDDDDDEEAEEDEEERERKKRRQLGQDASVKSFLSSMPLPKNSASSALGSGAAAGPGFGSSRRSAIETEVSEPAPSSSDASGLNGEAGFGSNVENVQSHGTWDYGSYAYGNEAAVPGDQSYAGYEAYGGYGSSGGYDNYGNYAQYDSSWYNASSGAVPPVASGTDTLGAVESLVGMDGKRRKGQMPAEIVEVNQEELIKNRPREDQSKLTGIAFGPSYQPAPSTKGKPNKLAKRKHQIGSLYFDLKQKEMELAERRSKGLLTKAETQAKYGW